ncbi:MAG: tRNA (N6-isopentenyl adenosine(37)-C2)-methylthiotransferase MiaB [Armatimonadetes bacterium]|nr:tRNA (N6-isopentenyl adenosine(37)-C2)-methylthiotransferase MiaB [Armatimonadota bacterium]
MFRVTSCAPKFIIFTWGCQMNEDDSEQIASLLMRMGYSPTDRVEEADIAMLVTCSVRAKPEEKAKSKLGQLYSLKKRRPEMLVGVCGCMAQRMGESIRRGRPWIDLVVGTGQISRIPDLIRQVRESGGSASALDLNSELPKRVDRESIAIKSFVPVMYGCDNYCAYCVVPYTRGRERSRPIDDVVKEVVDLARRGRKEVTLIGQNVNSYGSTLPEKVDFADLLRAVNEVDGIERIRFTTSHPKDLSDKLIETMRDLPKVCEHIHLPVQSGDDNVLRAMNRSYTSAHYRERVAALRQAIPDIAITTDLLVGFPGETDEQFENTMRLVEEVRFDSAFMFAYNPIPETAAEKMPNQVAAKVKSERLRRLIELQNRITCEINDSQVGQVYEVLVEGASPRDPSRLTGLTRQNKTVNFSVGRNLSSQENAGGDLQGLVGQLMDVRVTEGHLYGFTGELYRNK